jgi:hypothetical protein
MPSISGQGTPSGCKREYKSAVGAGRDMSSVVALLTRRLAPPLAGYPQQGRVTGREVSPCAATYSQCPQLGDHRTKNANGLVIPKL